VNFKADNPMAGPLIVLLLAALICKVFAAGALERRLDDARRTVAEQKLTIDILRRQLTDALTEESP
jgi:F0F1-type ATP synthase membrane subunit b/b'